MSKPVVGHLYQDQRTKEMVKVVKIEEFKDETQVTYRATLPRKITRTVPLSDWDKEIVTPNGLELPRFRRLSQNRPQD